MAFDPRSNWCSGFRGLWCIRAPRRQGGNWCGGRCSGSLHSSANVSSTSPKTNRPPATPRTCTPRLSLLNTRAGCCAPQLRRPLDVSGVLPADPRVLLSLICQDTCQRLPPSTNTAGQLTVAISLRLQCCCHYVAPCLECCGSCSSTKSNSSDKVFDERLCRIRSVLFSNWEMVAQCRESGGPGREPWSSIGPPYQAGDTSVLSALSTLWFWHPAITSFIKRITVGAMFQTMPTIPQQKRYDDPILP